MNYVRTPLGIGWGRAELKKPLADRHPIMQWVRPPCALSRKRTAVREPNGLYALDVDGVTSAFLHLAYKIFTFSRTANCYRRKS